VSASPNLTVVTDALCQRAYVRRDETAVGVEFRTGGEDVCEGGREEHPRRRRDRVAANAAALRGWDRILLAEARIPIVQDLPGVGENLHDHLQIRMQYKVKNVRTLNELANSFWGKAAMALEYFAVPHRPLTMPPSQLGAFARSDPVAADAEHRMARAAALARQVRRPAAPFPRSRRASATCGPLRAAGADRSADPGTIPRSS
jgi:choline dehydrogenase